MPDVLSARPLRWRGLRPTPLWGLRALGLLIVVAVLVPVLVLLSSWLKPEVEIWRHLVDTQLLGLVTNTLLLMFGVGVLVTLLGVSLAWFTVMCQFPGRAAFEWLLMLPLAVPAYVMAFVVLGIFDFGGPLQTQLRELLGPSWGIDVRNKASVIVVFTLVLYPYVYMLARSAFLSQSSETLEVARVLGCSSRQAFFRVALPMARPAIAAGVGLALMETLADFGTVAVFNYDTFTTAIYKSWFGFFSLQAAAQLASLLLLFVALTLFAERRSRGHGRVVQGAKLEHVKRYRLSAPLAWAATAYCVLILALAFILPMLQLVDWAIGEGLAQLTPRFASLLFNSLGLAAIAAVLTVVLALLLAFCRRFSRGRLGAVFAMAQLGYALPGSVLAVGVMLSFSFIDQHWLLPLQSLLALEPRPLLMGSVLALFVAYWIRFLAVASGPLESALERVKPSLAEVARTLGAGHWRLLREVYLPMLRPGAFTALVLVFVDVMKEMPATLLLRPFGWDTLAVRIFEMTAEGQWQLAALPALTLVLAGLLPVVLSIRASRGR